MNMMPRHQWVRGWALLIGLVCLGLLRPHSARALMEVSNNTNAIPDPGFPAGGIALANLPSREMVAEGPLGGMYHFAYLGDAAALNRALAAFAAVEWSDHVIVLHTGPASGSIMDPGMDWSVTIWTTNMFRSAATPPPPPSFGTAAWFADAKRRLSERFQHPPPQEFHMDVYLGRGLIDWSRVKLPAGVHVHDERTTIVLTYRDPATGIAVNLESDHHHVAALTRDGKLLWRRTPATDGNLPPYSAARPQPDPKIEWIGPADRQTNSVGIRFNSRQTGTLDLQTGDFTFGGQD
jgi:hypothetical protein